MTSEEFFEPFEQLIQAFSVQKAHDKRKIYFAKLERLSLSCFEKTCDYAVVNSDKFPTISRLIEISRMFPDKTGASIFECKECNSAGLIAKWKHSFRCTCLNGERFYKNYPVVPISQEDRKHWYGKLNKEWFDLYGKDLIVGKTYKGETDYPIVTKAKEVFGI